jgi:S-DNA-T family DNA segregation ATPase FtsK/SpoIIIE
MLGAGVKINKITGLSEDLSLALYGSSIRVVYPMKGRATVGIEVPRSPRELIYLDDVINSQNFGDSSMRLPIAMGKDSFGEVFVVDLAAMPHMLVAGATGSGKSVFVNTLLVSLLVKRSPSQMKLVLIDPKQLELALYSKLPHLIMPVVTDHKKASVALIWAVQEMERRYSILRELGVRNIEGFNLKLQNATPEVLSTISKFYTDVTDDGYELPYIVIVVDEFADLILTKSGKEIETNIARLAAKARASGMHIVLATQRPSVDVITGTIKSNFPTRVSFKVTTGTDSRTILNALGAEKLLGKGDMLYKYGVETVRVHSAFVDETEIEVLTSKLDNLGQNYNQQAVDFLENDGDVEGPGGVTISFGDASESDDGLYEQAVNIVMEHRSASASMLQRRLKIGYNRAANLVEMMEQRGVVGPAQGSKPRRVISGGASAELP